MQFCSLYSTEISIALYYEKEIKRGFNLEMRDRHTETWKRRKNKKSICSIARFFHSRPYLIFLFPPVNQMDISQFLPLHSCVCISPCVFRFPVIQQEQQFIKVWLLASYKLQEAHDGPHPPQLVAAVIWQSWLICWNWQICKKWG